MKIISRLLLRPALLAGRTGVSAPSYVSAATAGPLPSCTVIREWSSSSPSDEALRKAERMVEMMGQSSQMQQMMLNVMPAPLRNPEVLKQLFADPGMRRRIAEMIASRGMTIPDHVLERMSPASMDETFARASRLGLDPGRMFSMLMSHPGLLVKLQQPRVMSAFLDIAEDPARQAKYEGDKELLDVVFKVREILGTGKTTSEMATTVDATAAVTTKEDATYTASSNSNVITPVAQVQPPPPSQLAQVEDSSQGSAEETSTSSLGATNDKAQPYAVTPLVALMSSDPKAAKWLDNPEVMTALHEVQQSPWKTVKFIFNRPVMAAFQDLKHLMRGKTLS